MSNKQLASENTKANFGKGWIIIFYSMIMFWFLIGFSIDGQNIVAPAFAAKTGVEYAKVLSVASYAGFIGVLAYFIIGRITVKLGARMVSAVCLILAGASYMFYGNATDLTSYFIGLTLVTCFINGAAYIGGGTLITLWFPKKKGLANGFTTMGHNLGSALYVPLISFLIGAYGMSKGMTVTGIAAIVVGILGFIVVRNTPEECGIYPDNVTKEVYLAEYATSEELKSRWSVRELLATKEMWMVAIIIGINQLVTTGVMSQMVVRNMELGFDQGKAVSLMTLCAIVGLFGSYGFGYIDQKMGVKKAIISFLLWYSVALGVNFTLNNMLGGYICVAMVGIAIGAAANFMTSLPASVFGRHNFELVYSVYFPIMQIVLMLNYIINAAAVSITGSLRGSYVIFIILLIINVFITLKLDTKKYNMDYAKEEEILSK